MAALEIVSGFVTGAGSTFTLDTANNNNSFTVRSSNPAKNAWLIEKWAYNDTANGVLRVHSPRMHDNVQGIRTRITANNTEPLMSGAAGTAHRQRVYPQDTLIVEQTGSAANIDTAHLLLYYEDLPGSVGRFIDMPTLIANQVNRLHQEVSVTTTAASGQYTGQVAINSSYDFLVANTDYALLGAICDTRVGTIRIQGVDTGNLGVGIPGEPTQRHVGANWFARLSAAYNIPLIPVFNSANKGAILIDCTGHTAAITSVITLELVQLAPKGGSTNSGGQYSM